MEKIPLSFYATHDSEKAEELPHCLNFIKTNNVDYPCLIFVRINFWNDYQYFSHFLVFYFENSGDYHPLGTVKIIQYHAEEGRTKLPTVFDELPKEEFFSRGTLPFYNNLKLFGLKDTVLPPINDIHYNNYAKEDISNIGDGSLIYSYEQSLFRSDIYDLEVSSEYAKNSLEMINKIEHCKNSLHELEGEENKKIIKNLLYGSIIASLESYLGDAFKYHVMNNKNYFYSFLTNYDFSKGEKKYDLGELGLRGDKIGEFIEEKIKEIMDEIIFHRIFKVKELYKKILNISLPDTLIGFQEDILKRHDIFHRNGKNMAGVDIEIKDVEINSLISRVRKFIGDTEHILDTKI